MSAQTNINILLVEDNVFISQSICELMNASNYNYLDKAMSGEEALVMLTSKKYDIVLTDVEMGDINGLELLKRIRTGKAGVDVRIPVIVLTSHSDALVLGTAMALDANGFIAKPVKIGLLISKIRQVMTEKTAIRPAIAYAVISTTIFGADRTDLPEINQNELKNESEEAKTKIVDLDGLKAGMIIAADIKAKSGNVLIKAGTALNPNAIVKISELKNIMDGLEFEVYI